MVEKIEKKSYLKHFDTKKKNYSSLCLEKN